MATYQGWTEMREYRVWSGEDIWSTISVDRHANGRARVYQDSELVSRTTSLDGAYRDAHSLAQEATSEAETQCGCGEEAMECGSIYDTPHGVRLQIVDTVDDVPVESWEL